MSLSLELSQKAFLLWTWILRRLRTLESLPRNVSSLPLGLRWAWVGCASTGLLVCFLLLDILILEWGELDTLRRRSSKIRAYGVAQGPHSQSLIQGRWSGKQVSPVVWYFVLSMTWDGADGILVTCWFWVRPAVCIDRGSKAKQNKTCWACVPGTVLHAPLALWGFSTTLHSHLYVLKPVLPIPLHGFGLHRWH